MKRTTLIIIALASVAAIGLFFVFGKNTEEPKTEEVKQEEQKNSEEDTQSGNWEMPAKLNLEFPAEIPNPYNPCYSLEVPDEIKENREQLKDEIEKAKTRARHVLENSELPKEIHRGNNKEKFVALTIDTGTGGGEGIKEMLEIARHYNVDLTFFLTGCWILENPALAQDILAEGHSIGNHSLTHLNLAGAENNAIEREIRETDRIIGDALGFKPALFRKPQYAGGDIITSKAGEFGMVSVQGYPNLGDTGGWHKDSTAESVLNRIKRDTAPGAIWVMHNLSLSDLNAFEDVIRFHLENGYSLVRVEDII